MVYFITNGENIKIGYSKNINKRLKQLNTGNDKKLYILGYIQGDKDKEKEIHKKFSKFRIRSNGEWFYPDQELIDFLNLINEKSNTYICKNELFNNMVMAVLRI